MVQACTPDLGPENTFERCTDGADNDGNRYIDCNDFGCTRSQNQAILDYCAERMENTLERCGDGIDNDDNGFVDCNDFCSRSEDPEILALCAPTPKTPSKRVRTAKTMTVTVLSTAMI